MDETRKRILKILGYDEDEWSRIQEEFCGLGQWEICEMIERSSPSYVKANVVAHDIYWELQEI